jgi:phosphonoacetaldehyde hydrolase
MYSSRKFLNKTLQNFIYKGPIKAVIFGLEGTIIDPGCMAPVETLSELFSNYGIYVSVTDIRNNLHLKREDYIKQVFNQRVKDIVNKGIPTFTRPIEISSIINEYTELQQKYFKEYNTIIEGTHNLYGRLREEKLKIGVTTNYNIRLGNNISDQLVKENLKPDCFINESKVFNGNLPSPFMIYQTLDVLNIYPVQSVIKVDDTSIGIQEGLNAGCWTIGVSKWSNYTNYQSKYDLLQCSENIRNSRERCAREKLLRSGAHFVVSDISYVFDVIKLINEKLSKGEHPIDNMGF